MGNLFRSLGKCFRKSAPLAGLYALCVIAHALPDIDWSVFAPALIDAIRDPTISSGEIVRTLLDTFEDDLSGGVGLFVLVLLLRKLTQRGSTRITSSAYASRMT